MSRETKFKTLLWKGHFATIESGEMYGLSYRPALIEKTTTAEIMREYYENERDDNGTPLFGIGAKSFFEECELVDVTIIVHEKESSHER